MALKHSFDNYSDTYAEAQNRQMLLNLARLRNREPIYFFQLTQILAGYTFTETAGIGDIHERGLTTSPTTNFRAANATLGATATHNPVFTLVPLGGDKFAAQLLAPIKPEIFYELFEEGWPADLLMRVLIERMELVTPPDPKKEGDAEHLEILVNNPLEFRDGHYDRFLRACALARTLQQKGILYLDISKEFEPIAAQTVFTDPPTDLQQLAADKQGLVWRQTTQGGTSEGKAESSHKDDGPNVRTVSGGQAEHNSSQIAPGNWQLGRDVTQTLFKLSKGDLKLAAGDLGSSDSEFAGRDRLMERFSGVAENGIGVIGSGAPKGSYNVRLVMRSLLGVMLALANEQKSYDYFNDFRIKNGEATDHVPSFEDHPALTLNWDGSGAHESVDADSSTKPVVSLDYKGLRYSVEDRPGFISYKTEDPDRGDVTWNRDVFRLMVQLSLQVTADPSSFAQPLLQTH